MADVLAEIVATKRQWLETVRPRAAAEDWAGQARSAPPAADFFAAIKVDAFEDPARFKARVDGAIRELHGVRLAPGVDRVYAPGELELLTEAAYRRDGVPLNDVTLTDLRRVGAELGIDASGIGVV